MSKHKSYRHHLQHQVYLKDLNIPFTEKDTKKMLD